MSARSLAKDHPEKRPRNEMEALLAHESGSVPAVPEHSVTQEELCAAYRVECEHISLLTDVGVVSVGAGATACRRLRMGLVDAAAAASGVQTLRALGVFGADAANAAEEEALRMQAEARAILEYSIATGRSGQPLRGSAYWTCAETEPPVVGSSSSFHTARSGSRVSSVDGVTPPPVRPVEAREAAVPALAPPAGVQRAIDAVRPTKDYTARLEPEEWCASETPVANERPSKRAKTSAADECTSQHTALPQKAASSRVRGKPKFIQKKKEPEKSRCTNGFVRELVEHMEAEAVAGKVKMPLPPALASPTQVGDTMRELMSGSAAGALPPPVVKQPHRPPAHVKLPVAVGPEEVDWPPLSKFVPPGELPPPCLAACAQALANDSSAYDTLMESLKLDDDGHNVVCDTVDVGDMFA